MTIFQLKVGGSSPFAKHMLPDHTHAHHGQRSKDWGPSDVNIMNQ